MRGGRGTGGCQSSPCILLYLQAPDSASHKLPGGRGPCTVLRALVLQTLLLPKSKLSPSPTLLPPTALPMALKPTGARTVPLESSNQPLDLIPRRMYVYPSIKLWVPSRYSLRFVVQEPQFFSKVGHSAR